MSANGAQCAPLPSIRGVHSKHMVAFDSKLTDRLFVLAIGLAAVVSWVLLRAINRLSAQVETLKERHDRAEDQPGGAHQQSQASDAIKTKLDEYAEHPTNGRDAEAGSSPLERLFAECETDAQDESEVVPSQK